MNVPLFWSKTSRSGDCLIWKGRIRYDGYGQHGVYENGKKRQWIAHRLAFYLHHGQLPEWNKGKGLVLDHICRVRACVNPLHLEIVSSKENLHRSPLTVNSINLTKTACPKGHEYTARNVNGRWRRRCHTCENLARRKAA